MDKVTVKAIFLKALDIATYNEAQMTDEEYLARAKKLIGDEPPAQSVKH